MKAALTLLLLLICALPALALDYVWWEGEEAVDHNFDNTAFAPGGLDSPELLSGGNWLNTQANVSEGQKYAKWQVTVPATGSWYIYARKFWHHGPFEWRFGQGPWRDASKVSLLDNVDLRQFINANWVLLGKYELQAGTQSFEIRLVNSTDAAACFDCFALTDELWFPSGKLKPDEKSGLAETGWWAFEPGTDDFQPSPLDMRALNHPTAGAKGFLKRQGMDFVFEQDPTPYRFWAVNTGYDWVEMPGEYVGYLARKLAKAGVNLVRVHGPLFDPDAASLEEINWERIRLLHYFVAVMAQEGIYTELSFYFPLWTPIKESYGIPGYETIGNKNPFGLLFFDEKLQAAHRAWLKAALETTNLFTGMALKDDPALALVELCNEDNYFFWTFNPGEMIPVEAIAPLEEAFGEWAGEKYGSIQAAFDTWDWPQERDDAASGRAQLQGAWFMTAEGARNTPKGGLRMQDQVRFLAESQRGFYEQTLQWLRSEVGLKCPTISSNWITADGATLGAIDKWTNAACEVMDRHAYFDAEHVTERGWQLGVGDKYRDRLALKEPEAFSLREVQYEGHPCLISEYALSMINNYRLDQSFLAATYGALEGVDGLVHFSLDGPGWAQSLGKWPLMEPTVLGQFPLAALLYRRGDVPEAAPVFYQGLALDDLFALKGTGIEEPMNVDNLRAAGIPPGGTVTGGESRLDPWAFYVGKVVRSFEPGAETRAVDLSPYIDREQQTIKSLDGSLLWDVKRGLATVDTPHSQGATGLIGAAAPIELSALTINFGLEYGTVLLASLTDSPLADSGSLLLQLGAQARTYGWQESPEGELMKVENLGGPPLQVRKLQGALTLTFPGAEGLTVRALDPNGVPLERELQVVKSTGKLTLSLEPDVLYYHFSR